MTTMRKPILSFLCLIALAASSPAQTLPARARFEAALLADAPAEALSIVQSLARPAPEWLVELGTLQLRAGLEHEGLASLRAAEEASRGSAALAMAQHLAAQGAPEAAVAEWLEAHLRSRHRLTDHELRQAFHGTAFRQGDRLELCLRSVPASRAHQALCQAREAWAQGRPEEALELLEQEPARGHAPALALRARIHAELGQAQLAAELAREAGREAPREAAYARQEAQAWLDAGKPEKAAEALRRVPQDVLGLAELALLAQGLAAAKPDAEAEALWKRLELLRPLSAEESLARAENLLALGLNLEALRVCSEALRDSPNHPELLLSRGKAFARMGNLAQAQDDFSMSLDQWPRQSQTYMQRAQARWDAGDSGGACYDWRQAARLGNPSANHPLLQNCPGR